MAVLHGVLPAMLTPFDHRGRVDHDALSALTEFLIGARAHGLHPAGSTGETVLLTIDERKRILETVLATARGRVPVVTQVGTMRTEDAVELARHAHEVGAAAISVVTPYYYPLPNRALASYFIRVAGAVPREFPVYLYNIPHYTNNLISSDLLAHVMQAAPNVRGLKHSEANLDRLGGYLASGENVEVFIGSDGLVLAGLAMGAVGTVSGNANVVPELFVALYEAWTEGDVERARGLQSSIARIADLLGRGNNHAAFKFAAARRGLPVGTTVREPLAPLDADGERGAEAALEAFERSGVGAGQRD